MGWPVSQQFKDTLAGSDHHIAILIQVWNHSQKLADLPSFVTGSVAVDVTATSRRTVTLDFAATDTQANSPDDPDAIIPTQIGDLLYPVGNEVRPYRGFIYGSTEPVDPKALGRGMVNSKPGVPFPVPGYPGVAAELCPLGVFSISKPDSQDTQDTGNNVATAVAGRSLTTEVTGSDRSAIVSARKWTAPFVIASGTNLNRAIQSVIESRMPDFDLVFNMAPTNLTVPSTVFGTDLSGSNDPWADATSLATAAGASLWFDVLGQVQVRPVTDPMSMTPEFDGLYDVSSSTNTATSYGDVKDETQTFNGVIVEGVGSGGPPVKAEKWDTDSASPLYFDPKFPQLSTWGPRPFITQTTLVPSIGQTTEEALSQVQFMANNLYLQVHTILDTPNFTAVCNPALHENNLIYLGDDRLGLQDFYTLAQMTIPLDTTSTMSVTCAPQDVDIS